jgi:hypothetical protein
MEPLSAIALASSIISFIEFALKLVSDSREVCEAADGLTDENIRLEAVAARLSRISRALRTRGFDLEHVSDDDEAVAHVQSLQAIVHGCDEIATKLLAALETLRPKNDSKRSSVYAALKTIWKQPKLKKLNEQLRAYREDMVLHIIVLVQ